MKGLLLTILTYCIVISAEETAKANVKDNILKELENTREDLLKKINGAIDESVIALGNANDSESVAGLQYLTKLKNQLKAIDSENDTEITNQEDNVINKFNLTDLTEFRRMLKNTKKGKKSGEDPVQRAQFFDFETKYKKKIKKTTVSDKQRKIEENIQLWLEEREREKAKIKQYKERIRIQDIGKETCPDFGVNSKKRRIGSKKRKGDSKKKTYPCCRKCCKTSYLGCL